MPAFAKLRSRLLDGLTVLIFVFAVYLGLQPGSYVRNAWAQYQIRRAGEAVSSHSWTAMANHASPSGETPSVVEVSDYECPFCRQTWPSVDSALQRGVRISVLHLPLPFHQHARGAAIAAICADRQGAFRQYHAALMTSEKWQTDTNWVALAKSVGISDTSAFKTCLASPVPRAQLAADSALADSLRVVGTPTFYARGRLYQGAVSTSNLTALAAGR